MCDLSFYSDALVNYPWLPPQHVHCDRPPNQIPSITPIPTPSHCHACPPILLRPLVFLHIIPKPTAMESSMYKTPSPITGKRRLSGIPTSRRPDRAVSDQISRIQRESHDFEDPGQRSRRRSIATGQEILKAMKDETTDSVDASMGFRELERVFLAYERVCG